MVDGHSAHHNTSDTISKPDCNAKSVVHRYIHKLVALLAYDVNINTCSAGFDCCSHSTCCTGISLQYLLTAELCNVVSDPPSLKYRGNCGPMFRVAVPGTKSVSRRATVSGLVTRRVRMIDEER